MTPALGADPAEISVSFSPRRGPRVEEGVHPLCTRATINSCPSGSLRVARSLPPPEREDDDTVTPGRKHDYITCNSKVRIYDDRSRANPRRVYLPFPEHGESRPASVSRPAARFRQYPGFRNA